MRHAICILTNDLTRFEIISRNFPANMPDLFVINDTRLGDKVDELKQIYSNATFIKGKDILDDFSNHENVSRFGIILKLLIPDYMFKNYDYDKILVIDDDIIVTDKISELFEINNNAVIRSPTVMDANDNVSSPRCKAIRLAVNAFNMPLDFKHQQFNGGQVLYYKKLFNADDYANALVEYICNPTFTSVLNAQKSWATYALDELFTTTFMVKYGFEYFSKYVHLHEKKYIDTDLTALDRKLKAKALVHIVTRINKLNIFRDLQREGIIK